MESYSGTTQHSWLHASLTISALPLDLDGKSFGISLFSYTAQWCCTTSRNIDSSEPVLPLETGGMWGYELEFWTEVSILSSTSAQTFHFQCPWMHLKFKRRSNSTHLTTLKQCSLHPEVSWECHSQTWQRLTYKSTRWSAPFFFLFWSWWKTSNNSPLQNKKNGDLWFTIHIAVRLHYKTSYSSIF